MFLEYQELAAMEKRFPIFPFATGAWRQVCATWRAGGSESLLALASVSLGVSVFRSCERRARGQGTPTRCSSCPGADGKGAAGGGGRDVSLPGMCFVPIFTSSPSPGQCCGLSSLIAAVMWGKGERKPGTESPNAEPCPSKAAQSGTGVTLSHHQMCHG